MANDLLIPNSTTPRLRPNVVPVAVRAGMEWNFSRILPFAWKNDKISAVS